MSVDVAGAEGGGKYTAMTLWGHLYDRWYLTARHRFQYYAAKVRQAMKLDQQYLPHLIVIDSGGIGNSLVSELRFQGFKHIYPCVLRFSKLRRAEEIVAMIEVGRIPVTGFCLCFGMEFQCRLTMSGLKRIQRLFSLCPSVQQSISAPG